MNILVYSMVIWLYEGDCARSNNGVRVTKFSDFSGLFNVHYALNQLKNAYSHFLCLFYCPCQSEQASYHKILRLETSRVEIEVV